MNEDTRCFAEHYDNFYFTLAHIVHLKDLDPSTYLVHDMGSWQSVEILGEINPSTLRPNKGKEYVLFPDLESLKKVI